MRPVSGVTRSQTACRSSLQDKDDTQCLPQKDMVLFQNLLKLSEEKMYNRALKVANDLLKRHPSHGETLSMKAMVLSYTSADRTEAINLAKLGLKNNISSTTCWHVLGILNRSEKNFPAALCYFRQAHRLSPDVLLLLRDLATLQIHERDLAGLLETRKKTIVLRPNLKLYWVAYAIANHFMGYYLLAVHVVRKIMVHFSLPRDRYGDVSPQRKMTYEDGELKLYEAVLLEEAGLYDDAIKCLENTIDDAGNKFGRLEILGRLYIYVKDYTKAHKIFGELFRSCTTNQRYLLCFFVTHPDIAPLVVFPSSPLEANQFKEQRLTLHADKKRQSQDGINNNPVQPDALLCLSPYPLSSSQLVSVDSPGWCAHPKHLLYPNVNHKKNNHHPLNVHKDKSLYSLVFMKLRKMTEYEEIRFCTWIYNDVLHKSGGKLNDSVLRLSLEIVDSPRRVLFFADCLLRPRVYKGTPFAINMVKALLCHPEKSALIQQVFQQYICHAEQYLSCLRDNPETNEASPTSFLGSCIEPPPELHHISLQDNCDHNPTRAGAQAAYVGLLCNLAQMYDRLGNSTTALEIISKAITHTPSLIDLYHVKARILKHKGLFKEAADVVIHARNMDIADRYTNTQAVEYCLKAGNLEMVNNMTHDVDPLKTLMCQADTFAVFYSIDQKKENLIEMQSMRYELLYGKAALETGNRPLAIKYFYDVVKHFKEMHDDQLDFHLYAFHTGALRQYIQFLRMQNRIEAQKFYRASIAQIVYLLLEEYNSSRTSTTNADDLKLQNNNIGEVVCDALNDKTVINKKTKPGPKNKQKAEEVPVSLRDKDVTEGKKLLAANQYPLREAVTLTQKLCKVAQLDIMTHKLAFHVFFHTKQILLLCQSLYRLWILLDQDLYDPFFSPLLCEFLCYVINGDLTHDDHQALSEALDRKAEKRVDHISTVDQRYVSRHSASLTHGIHFLIEEFFVKSQKGHSTDRVMLFQNEDESKKQITELLYNYLRVIVECSTPTALNAALHCLSLIENHLPELNDGSFSKQIEGSLLRLNSFGASLSYKSCAQLFQTIRNKYPSLTTQAKSILMYHFPSAPLFS